MKEEDGTMTRRDFVKAAAGAAAVAAVAGTGSIMIWDRTTQPEGPVEAWNAATGIDRILLAATMAPSSHNTQPWRFRADPEGIDVLADMDRTMGKADPRLRELHVSLGCALENAVIAAASAGTPVVADQVSGTPSGRLTRLRFAAQGSGADANADLADAIPLRRTNRGPFDEARTVAPSELTALDSLASENVRVVWLTDPVARARFADLSMTATEAHIADAEIQRDSHRWYRMSRPDAEKYRDGITVSGANLPGAIGLIMGLFPPSPDSFDAGWAKATRDTHCGTAPAFGMLVVENAGDKSAWVEAGRTYERIQLAGAMRGISTHPISQALAIRDREVVAGSPEVYSAGLTELGGAGEVVLAFRIGYPTREQPPSMRRAPVVVQA
ncbi:MAG: twin-arginine translocation signal domain-containing protein [Coriobacteriia bacterium]|nr:twin-arginine translocation signal domain-containing protein [Coriobacteriia bacterium]